MDWVELEVYEPLGEHKHVTLVENLGEWLVTVVCVGGDKSNIECTLEYGENLCGTWVGVWRILT